MFVDLQLMKSNGQIWNHLDRTIIWIINESNEMNKAE